MVRQDKFQAGDLVTFIEEDPYNGSGISENHRRDHGNGPYLVTEVEELKSSTFKSSGHTQWLEVDGHIYSGYWFNPVR